MEIAPLKELDYAFTNNCAANPSSLGAQRLKKSFVIVGVIIDSELMKCSYFDTWNGNVDQASNNIQRGKDHSEMGVGEIIHQPTVEKVKVVKINQQDGRWKQQNLELVSSTNVSGGKKNLVIPWNMESFVTLYGKGYIRSHIWLRRTQWL